MVRLTQLSSSASPLFGREAEQRLVEDLIIGVVAGRGGVLLVEGEPGIGKSALLRAVCDMAAAHGCALLRDSTEIGQPWAVQPAEHPVPVAGSGADAVVTAVERMLALVDEVSSEVPTVLVVDDLHTADAATVSAWHRLARSARQRRLLLVGAVRPLARRPDLRALRRVVVPRSLLRLGPLSDSAVRHLVATLIGGEPGPALLRLAKGAAGNPAYVAELVRALARDGQLKQARGVVEATGEPGPHMLMEVVGARLGFLSDPVREVLKGAALLGREFGVDELAVVVKRGPNDLVRILGECRAAGILTESNGALIFRHGVIQAALYHELPARARVVWHCQAARGLQEAGIAPERVASQLLSALEHDVNAADSADTASAALGDLIAGWGADWLIVAAPALVAADPEMAIRLLERAARYLALDDARRHILTGHLARALAYRGRYDDVDALITQILPNVTDLNVLIDLDETVAATRVTRCLPLDDTLADPNHPRYAAPELTHNSRLRLKAIAALVHLTAGELGKADQVARVALAEAAEADDLFAMALLLNQLAAITANIGNVRESAELLDRGLAIADEKPEFTDVRLAMLKSRADMARLHDQPQEARRLLAEARRIALRAGNARQVVNVQHGLCELLFAVGEWDAALAEANLPQGVEAVADRCVASSVTAIIELHRGEARRAEKSLAVVRRLAQRLGRGHAGLWALAQSLEREVAGDPAGGLTILSRALAGDVQRSFGQVDAEAGLADTVRLAVETGHYEVAASVTDQAEKLASFDASARRRGTAAHCRGLVDGDTQLLLGAADAYREAGRPLPRAQALEAAALQQADRGQQPAALETIASALAAYTALGANWDIGRLRARFRSQGFRLPRARVRAGTGWDALTKTEAKVAELLAEGLSNTEIADKLVISSRTVESHVSKILAKLQVRSRVDVARVAADRQTG